MLKNNCRTSQEPGAKATLRRSLPNEKIWKTWKGWIDHESSQSHVTRIRKYSCIRLNSLLLLKTAMLNSDLEQRCVPDRSWKTTYIEPLRDLPNLGLVFLIDALARWIWNKVELVHEDETFRVRAQRTDRIACRLEILIIFDLDIYGLQKRNPGIVFVSCTA